MKSVLFASVSVNGAVLATDVALDRTAVGAVSKEEIPATLERLEGALAALAGAATAAA